MTKTVFNNFYILILVVLSFFANKIYCQDKLQIKTDTSHYQQITNAVFKIYPYNKKRMQLVAVGNVNWIHI